MNFLHPEMVRYRHNKKLFSLGPATPTRDVTKAHAQKVFNCYKVGLQGHCLCIFCVESSMSSPNLTDSSPCRWCLNDRVSGPALATFVSIEFVLSLTINLFICVFTLMHARTMLKKASTLLLFNLALSNLFMTILYMPFVIVASGAEEWIIGQSDEVRNGFCQFTGFVFAYATTISVDTLAAISFDRFLFIAKAHIYHRIMTWKTALGIVAFIWVSLG